uniref:HMG box domain-containing protein n=1 Tax=Steinernema glaseri TaxID=37863 RepID=A0A1I8A6J9_9BILA
MSTIHLLRNLSLSARRAATAHKRLPKGFNRPSAMAVFIQNEAKNKTTAGSPVALFTAAKDKWNSLSDVDKKKYKDEAIKIGQQRRQEFEKLPVSQQEDMIRESLEQKERLAKNAKIREQRREREAKGYPKLPPNAFALYVKKQLTGQAFNTDRMGELAKAWKTMAKEEKSVFEKEAEHLKKEYEAAKAKIDNN